ncbi:pyrimidine dimer DNA glycosylase/endonuclease V [Gulosibacter sp. 10]|uniref:pyrimidine dimer DNA glycosylase/endonuclease V n=1 Tax=Gulosibacter sp. 10 TaxID=1255570 RepID=UPI00097EA072|nr:pyrimidine dimer DNA glycosylase/endonuclease V [Gulosibacter sp. 10]SJM60956.1 pyrimidine dimer DNA glycosylase [Gulosibacter sp. 10]
MRLWSLHPSLLDRQGLLACWREALLAQAVLLGRTRGYVRHPQLERFREHPDPDRAIGAYLAGLLEESRTRGYRFDAARIVHPPEGELPRIPVTTGQVEYEWSHLRAKLADRSPEVLAAVEGAAEGRPVHPLFEAVPGGIATWERP